MNQAVPVVKKKKKTRKQKASGASRDMSNRPIAVSIVHVNTTESSGNTADADLKRMLSAGKFI